MSSLTLKKYSVVAFILLGAALLFAFLPTSTEGSRLPAQAAAPFWLISPEFDSVLILNNSLSRELVLEIRLFDDQGSEGKAKQVVLSGRESRILSLSDSFELKPSQSGSLLISYDGHPYDPGAQVELIRRAGGSSIDVPCFFRPDFSSPHLDGLFWQPKAASSRLLVANTTSETKRFHLAIRDSVGLVEERDEILSPFATFSLDGKSLPGPAGGEQAAGIDLNWVGEPGSDVGGRFSGFAGFFVFLEQKPEEGGPQPAG